MCIMNYNPETYWDKRCKISDLSYEFAKKEMLR